jgi:hypothetical protein
MSHRALALRGFGLTVAIAFALAVAPAGSGARAHTRAASPPGSALIRRAQQFRAQFGLSTDRQRIRRLWTDRAADRSFGIPLSRGEALDLRARIAAERQLPSIQRFALSSTPRTFAGVYVDQRRGGLIVISFTRGARERVRALRARLSRPGLIRARTARFSLAQLESLHARVDREWSALRSLGITVIATTTDIPHNAVGIAVTDTAPRTAALLERRYGPGIRVFQAQAAPAIRQAQQSPPFRGGTEINSSDAEPGFLVQCTAGFVGRSASGAFFVMTAGHCGDTGSSWIQGFPLGTPIGTMAANTFVGATSSADSSAIGSFPSVEASNQIFAGGAFRSITGIAPADFFGETVCKSGITTELTCGAVDSTDVTVNYGVGPTLFHQHTAAMKSFSGDSGGPIFVGNSADGILSGIFCSPDCSTVNNVTDTIYTPITSAQSALGVNVFTG